MDNKLVIINRAVSGCGKSTISNILKKECLKKSITVNICSTDNFFMLNGIYRFDSSKLNEYHQKNLKKVYKTILI